MVSIEVEEATRVEADYRVAERGSTRVADFDFGNSPTEVALSELPRSAEIVLSTTNGTQVTQSARGAPVRMAGAFVNANAVTDELADGVQGARAAVICCGCEGCKSGEDEPAAGVILHRLQDKGAKLDERTKGVVGLTSHAPKSLSAKTALPSVLSALVTRKTSNSVSLRTPYRSSPVSWEEPSSVDNGVEVTLWTGGQNVHQNLDRDLACLYSEVGHGGRTLLSVAKPPRKGGADYDDNYLTRESQGAYPRGGGSGYRRD